MHPLACFALEGKMGKWPDFAGGFHEIARAAVERLSVGGRGLETGPHRLTGMERITKMACTKTADAGPAKRGAA